jgi:hypothetical protein
LQGIPSNSNHQVKLSSNERLLFSFILSIPIPNSLFPKLIDWVILVEAGNFPPNLNCTSKQYLNLSSKKEGIEYCLKHQGIGKLG